MTTVPKRSSIQRRLLVTAGITFFISMVLALILIVLVVRSRLSDVYIEVSSGSGQRGEGAIVTSGKVTEVTPGALSWSSLVWMGVASIVILAVAAVLSAQFISRQVFSRLQGMTDIATALDADQMQVRFETTAGHDEIDQMAVAMNGALDRLQSGIERQKLFVHAAAHELRTPLTVARTSLEVPIVENRVPVDLLPDIEQALESQHRLEEMLETLLLLSRGEKPDSGNEIVFIDDVVRRAIAQHDPDSVLQWRSTLDRVSITGPPLVAELIIRNLIANAVTHNVEKGWVEVELTTRGNGVEFSIENTGALIDSDSMVELRQPFTRRPGSPGTGLGLSVVEQLVSWLNGDLTITARDHGGLRVVVRFLG